MTLYIIRRLQQSVLVILIMLVLVFVSVYVIGNPVDVLVSTEADQEEFDRMVRILGLDQPLWKQILIYVSNLVQGDFGRSFAFSEPALKLVVQRMPATLELVFVAMVMALVTGIPLGMYTGLRPDTVTTRFIMLRGDRDGLRMAGHGQADHRFRLYPRPSGHLRIRRSRGQECAKRGSGHVG